MRYMLTPTIFHQIANMLWHKRWQLIQWSVLGFLLFLLLQSQVGLTTPNVLVWIALFILFFALQALVIASFIFFFKNLPSAKAKTKQWFTFYRAIEWCETIIFTLLMPFPSLVYIYLLMI